MSRTTDVFPLPPNTTNATAYTIHLGSGSDIHAAVEHGPLSRIQGWLWARRLWWFGNRISDVRYWLWRLCR